MIHVRSSLKQKIHIQMIEGKRNWSKYQYLQGCQKNGTYKFSSAVSNVKLLDTTPCKLLLERSLNNSFQVIPNQPMVSTYMEYIILVHAQKFPENTHSDIILIVLPLVFLHFTPSQANLGGKHGSPIQFLFISYSSLIDMIASTSIEKGIWPVLSNTYQRIKWRLQSH